MLSARQQTIVQLARDNGFVMIETLAEQLQVTTQTIRRDIGALCDAGVLTRFHGGASYRSSVANVPYEARRDTLSTEKEAIAQAVAAEIADASSVFIDIGTTAETVARALVGKRDLRIVTNNLNVVSIFAGKDDVDITVSCGQIRQRDLAILGDASAEFVERFQLDFSILGVVSITAGGDILDYSLGDARLTQAILGCGRRAFVVADHSKFGRPSIAKVAHVRHAHTLFTDRLPEGGAWKQLSEWTRVVQAQPARSEARSAR